MTLLLIRDYRHAGLGRHGIAKRLNEHGIPAFLGKLWRESSVSRLVRSKALIGIYQPHSGKDGKGGKGSPIGDPIRFYPRVMLDADWWRMQWPEDGEYAPAGRKSKRVKNLLTGVCHCGHPECGSGLHFIDNGKRSYLRCGAAKDGGCKNDVYHPYDVLETELLSVLRVLDFSRFVHLGTSNADKIEALRAEIAANNLLLEKMAEDFHDGMPKAFVLRAQRIEAETETKQTELYQLERDAKIAETAETVDAYGAFLALIKRMDELAPASEELFLLRLKLQTDLRGIIKDATALDTELVIRLRTWPGMGLELVFDRSVLQGIRVNSDHALYWLPADQYVRRPEYLVPALLAHFQQSAA
jgi:hypothetical protein